MKSAVYPVPMENLAGSASLVRENMRQCEQQHQVLTASRNGRLLLVHVISCSIETRTSLIFFGPALPVFVRTPADVLFLF